MAPRGEPRKYDIIVIGATGYTGALTAEYIALNLPNDLKWAIAGRSRSKLEELATKLKNLRPDRPEPAIETTTLDDQAQVHALVGSSKVCISVITYWKNSVGDIVVQACIDEKTDYLDVEGDAILMKTWIQKYHKAAESAGVALIHACGAICSISDILTWTAVRELRTSASLKTKEAILAVKEFDPNASGGTAESVMHSMTLDPKVIEESNRPWTLSPVQGGDDVSPSMPSTFGLRRDPDLGLLSNSSATSGGNRPYVHRTWGLLRNTDEDYGPNFRYTEYSKASSVLSGLVSILGSYLVTTILSYAPLRALAKRVLPKPGEGPDLENAKNSRLAMELVAVPDVPDNERNTAPRAHSVFSYPSSSYYVTGLMLAHGAASLLYTRELEGGYAGGSLTPAFLGDDFVRRIRSAGAVLKTELLPASTSSS